MTNYAVIIGPEAGFGDNGKKVGFQRITDGTSNTIGVIERATPVNWMAPVDITFEEAAKGIGVSKDGIADAHDGGCNCVAFHGRTHFLLKDIDLKVLRALLTRAGGEPISFPE